jgi:hypothetical protein
MQRVHVVGVGESPESIARLYGVHPLRLLDANPHKPLDGDDEGRTFAELADGEAIYVPAPPPSCGCSRPGGQSGMQGDAPSVGNVLPQNSQQVISDVLTQAGVTQAGVQSAITSYTGVGLQAQNAVMSIVNGGPVNLTTTAPIVATGLAFIPGIGPAVAAAYLAVIPVLNMIGQLFSSSPASCTGYMVGNVCFTKTRPYGPTIPAGVDGAGGPNPDWETWDTFAAGLVLSNCNPLTAAPDKPAAPGQSDPCAFVVGAFPSFVAQLGPQVLAAGTVLGPISGDVLLTITHLDTPTTTVPAIPDTSHARAQFVILYATAWKKNAEFTLNGYQGANPYDLFKGVAAAWNATHVATANDWTPGASTSPTLTAALGAYPFLDAAQPDYVPRMALANKGYLDSLVNGEVDGQQYVPITLHMGAVTTPSGSTSSGAVYAAAAGGVAAGGGLLAWLALGRPSTWSAFKAALGALTGD